MTQTYVRLADGVTIDPPGGGRIRSGGEVYAPTTLHGTPTGAAFGPLYLGIPNGDSYMTVENIRFLPGEDGDGDGVLFFGITAGGVAGAKKADEKTSRPLETTRRSFLTVAALVIAAALAADDVSAQSDDTVALEIASITVTTLTAPLTIRVLNAVDDVLPTTTEILVDAESSRVGEIADASEGVTLPAETTGEISVYLRDSRSKLAQLLAWARGIADGDEQITYERDLPKEAANYDAGQLITLSEHPALVEPVRESGADGTVLMVGNTEIPHTDDESSEVGSYGVFNGQLIYEIGPRPPAATSWSLETRLGTLARIRNSL